MPYPFLVICVTDYVTDYPNQIYSSFESFQKYVVLAEQPLEAIDKVKGSYNPYGTLFAIPGVRS